MFTPILNMSFKIKLEGQMGIVLEEEQRRIEVTQNYQYTKNLKMCSNSPIHKQKGIQKTIQGFR